MGDEARAGPALFRRFPELEGTVPWVRLARLPTPGERMVLHSAEGDARAIRVKRDDLSGGVYGGNKVRKLEFLLARAREEGAGRILTAGGTGSHHALATALLAGRMGWPVTLVLSPQPESPHAREVRRAIERAGAEIREVSRGEELARGLEEEAGGRAAERPFVIPPGGSDAVGSLGYLSAALELGEQLEAEGAPWPEVMYLAAGTLGTAAGLALGLELAGAPTRIVGVRVVGKAVTNRDVLRDLLRECAGLVASHLEDERPGWAAAAEERVELRQGYLGEGYGHSTPEGEQAVTVFQRAGLALDPTYTAKAAAALLDDLREPEEGEAPGSEAARRPEARVLFWHTLSAVMP